MKTKARRASRKKKDQEKTPVVFIAVLIAVVLAVLVFALAVNL